MLKSSVEAVHIVRLPGAAALLVTIRHGKGTYYRATRTFAGAWSVEKLRFSTTGGDRIYDTRLALTPDMETVVTPRFRAIARPLALVSGEFARARACTVCARAAAVREPTTGRVYCGAACQRAFYAGK